MKNKNLIVSSNVSLNNRIVVIGNEVIINGVKMPPCPSSKEHHSTVINNKVYLNGYELINGKWKRTLKALWHNWF